MDFPCNVQAAAIVFTAVNEEMTLYSDLMVQRLEEGVYVKWESGVTDSEVLVDDSAVYLQNEFERFMDAFRGEPVPENEVDFAKIKWSVSFLDGNGEVIYTTEEGRWGDGLFMVMVKLLTSALGDEEPMQMFFEL